MERAGEVEKTITMYESDPDLCGCRDGSSVYCSNEKGQESISRGFCPELGFGNKCSLYTRLYPILHTIVIFCCALQTVRCKLHRSFGMHYIDHRQFMCALKPALCYRPICTTMNLF